MTGRTYRLKTPTLAILTMEDGHKIPKTVPQSGMVRVITEGINGNRFVDVIWQSKVITMFAVDLRERGELVASTGA